MIPTSVFGNTVFRSTVFRNVSSFPVYNYTKYFRTEMFKKWMQSFPWKCMSVSEMVTQNRKKICSLACWKINFFFLRNTDGVCALRDSMSYCLSRKFVLVVWLWELNHSIISTLFFISCSMKNLHM